MVLHPLLRRVFDAVFSQSIFHENSSSREFALKPEHVKIDSRLNQRISFDVAFSLVFLIALHGFSALKVLIILYINYSLATRLKKDYVPIVTWVFNIGILFANELGKGYPFATIEEHTLSWYGVSEASSKQRSWGTLLDSYGGLNPRWEVLFNITVLRLISFNLDYYWSLNNSGGSPVEVCTYQTQSRAHVDVMLTATRRSSLILRICRNGTGLIYQPRLKTTRSEITSHTPCIRLSTLQDRS